MATDHTCRKCGGPLASGSRHGFCAKCLVLQARGCAPASLGKSSPEDPTKKTDGPGSSTSSAPNRQTGSADQVGDYELLQEIGRGGMGVVYRAQQRSLNRIVALKMMAFGPGSSPELIKRFRAEAVSAASLHHPNIVTIHEVGVHEDRHFFVMDHVEGQSLARLVGNQPLPAKRAAAYLKIIAEAVHYAHERGILHRDLKPSNILIDEQDQPRIVDFGLAKRFDDSQLSTLHAQLTVTGQVLGSPHYLPPEQATGQRTRISRRTDVYALGATLYHLLTGRPPFQAESLALTLDLVRLSDPVAPRVLNLAVPVDLETICLKCLEKEPARRYASARELADELGRFLAGEPIRARPLGAVGKAWRWCRRKPQVAGLAGVAVLLFVLGITGVVGMWGRAEVQRRRAENGELNALRNAYVFAMNSAQQALKADNRHRALTLLSQYGSSNSGLADRRSSLATDFRGFEWRYLWQQCQTEEEAVIGKLQIGISSLDVSADGQWLYAGSKASGGGVWNLTTGHRVPFAAEGMLYSWGAISPDSRWLLICDQTLQSEGIINVWDLQARRKVSPIVDGRPLASLRFSPDGKRFGYVVMLARGIPALVVLDVPGWQQVCELVGKGAAPKGWDWEFTRDGQCFIASENDAGRRIVLQEIVPDSEPRFFPGHGGAIMAIALSPDGRLLATGAEETEANIKLWEVPSFRPVGELSGHKWSITALKFSPDGRILASAGADRTMRLWEVPTGKTNRVFTGLFENVWRLAFGPGGQGLKLFSGSSDGTIRRYSLKAQNDKSCRGFWRRPAGREAAAVAPDGLKYAAVRQGRVYLGEVQGMVPPSEVVELGTNNTCLLFSFDSQSLFAGTESGEIQAWSSDRRRPLLRLRGAPEPVSGLQMDEQGRLLVAVHWRQGVELGRPTRGYVGMTSRFEIWTTADWRQQKSWTIPTMFGACFAVSPDGRWLAVIDMPGSVRVWSLTGSSQVKSVSGPAGWASSLAFSPDGKFLAVASSTGTVKIWEMPLLREQSPLEAHAQDISALTFSPDSRRLATAGAEVIRLWDVETWKELITLERPGEQLGQLTFSADGNQLTALNSAGDFLFWRVPSFAEIAPPESENPGLK